MAEPIIIIRENGLVLEVDLGNERCRPPVVSPDHGQHKKFEIRWSDADFKAGRWEVTSQSGHGGKEEAVLKWNPKGGQESEAC